MKLYTGEQLVDAIKATIDFCFDDIPNAHKMMEEYLGNITPIELPTDKDTSHLQWIYDRMSNVHDENENYDYMLKFKEIIDFYHKIKGGQK